jgi:hypothetical protein
VEKFQNKGAKIVLSGKTEDRSHYETGWELAQLVEQLIFNLRVTGSNPVFLISAKSAQAGFLFLPWKEVSQ